MENFTTNLNQLARVGGIDPLIGREKELERAIQVLCRRRKNNPLLVGNLVSVKPRLQKVLPRRIVQGDVPEVMADCTIYSLDIGSLLAGTKYRGDFEKTFLKRCSSSWSRTLTASCLLMRSTPLSVRGSVWWSGRCG